MSVLELELHSLSEAQYLDYLFFPTYLVHYVLFLLQPLDILGRTHLVFHNLINSMQTRLT